VSLAILDKLAVLELKHNEMSATRQSWSNLQPMPAQRSALSLQREFTEQEYELICRGLIPERMEDKWFIFVEGDTLYMHRSWTGYCIYRLSFIRDDTIYVVGDAFVNRDTSQYSGIDDRYDERLVMFLIDSLLLGEHSPLPITAHVPAGIATELHLHHVVGAGQRAEEIPKEITILGILGWLWRWLLWLVKN
jgi:hypothetical protein